MTAIQPLESMMHRENARSPVVRLLLLVALALAAVGSVRAQSNDEDKLARAVEVLRGFTTDDEKSIPADLLQRARGIAIIPTVVRGGFLIGGRRGRGVLAVRTPSGEWSNPAFITLTGGSIGWQFGAEAADVVLVFGNDRSVRNISSGKFTLGGDAAAVAGPLGKRTTAVVTARSEVYIYTQSRGLFAGAAFEGARLDVDEEGNALFYGDGRAALGSPDPRTPASAVRFLESLANATSTLAFVPGAGGGTTTPANPKARDSSTAGPADEAIIYPIEEGPQ
jgi:lipid-binding SYLF domain-containing protein